MANPRKLGHVQVYFRSDKANMQPEEIAAKQQQASELQDELRKQIEEKKRVKVPQYTPAALCLTLCKCTHDACDTAMSQCLAHRFCPKICLYKNISFVSRGIVYIACSKRSISKGANATYKNKCFVSSWRLVE